jgi:hypothetical protein
LSDKTENPKYKGTIEYIKDNQSHHLDDRLVCVDCGRTFEHIEVEKAKGKIAKELTRIAYPHPNRVYPVQLLLCDSIKLLDAARAEWPKDTDLKYKDLLFTNRRIALTYDRGVWFTKYFGAP